MFKHWRISKLLSFWAGLTIALVLLMTGVAILNHEQYAENQQVLIEEFFPLYEQNRQLTGLAAVFITQQSLLLNAESQQPLVDLASREKLNEQFEGQWMVLLDLIERLQIESQQLKQLQQSYQNFVQVNQQMFELLHRRNLLTVQLAIINTNSQLEKNTHFQLANRIQQSQLNNEILLREGGVQSLKAFSQFQDGLNELSAKATKQALNATEHAQHAALSLRWLIIISAALLMSSMLFFAVILSRHIKQPLQLLRNGMRDLTAEKFDTRLASSDTGNEFALLANDFNLFAANTEQLITALDTARDALQTREQHISAIINGVPEAILTVQSDGQITTCNPAAEKVFAASQNDLIGYSLFQFIRSDSASSLVKIAAQQHVNREFEGVKFNGQPFSLWLSLSHLADPHDDLSVCVISDITAWKQTKLQLQQTGNELNAIFENAMVGIALIKGRRLIRINHKFEQLFGGQRKQLEGQSTRIIHLNEDSFKRFGEQAYNELAQGESFEAQFELQRLNGERFWCAMAGQAIDPQDLTTGTIWLFEDVTQQRANEERLTQLASVDSLTGLPNRTVFNDRLEHALHKLQRSGGRLAVFFIDLDHFKHINDSLGHRAGDALLCEVSKRIRSCVRVSDTVARLGGDEFTVVLEDVKSARYVGRIAEKILGATTLPYLIDEIEVNISPSIGISLYPADGRDVDMLIRNADAAMYHAKQSGRNNFQFYSVEMNAEAANRLALETSLRRAVEQNEFYLQFQPQIELQSGRVMGAEVLLRWHTEQWGDMSPARFVPVLETTGLIGVVGEWVLRQTCEVFMNKRSQLPDDFVMAVNLSSRQFKGSRLVNYIRDLLLETEMPAANLELEITESLLMDNTDLAIENLRELSELGITLAIDDFGTGYSSLSYLKQFSLNVLKIDRAFIRDVIEDKDDAAIVGAIMALAESLGLQVVAEGVETAKQLAFLQQKHCQRAQGFYFSKALDIEMLMDFMPQRDAERRA